MTTINTAYSSGAPLPLSTGGNGGRLAGLERQLAALQKQFGEVACCTTTPAQDKQQQELALQQQMNALQAQMDQLQQGAPNQSAQPAVDAANSSKPTGGAAGAVIDLYV